jgi:membrane associated rhomboid family serine protease
MIVPWIKGFQNWSKAPLTWTLIVLNLFIFLQTYEASSKSVTRAFSNVEMMVLTGKLFSQYTSPEEKSLPLKSQNEWLILGGQGLKDPDFIERAATFPFHGDDVAIEDWRNEIRTYQHELKDKTSHQFGLHSQHSSPLTWITYQFMHASWTHLIGNMIMLLIFGAALETVAGSLWLGFIYILTGIAGAWAFLILGHETLAPMIGASGSLSGVMAFYAAFEKKKRVSFFYFISPFPGYYGWIYLPTLLIFPLCFLSDLAGYLSTPAEIGTGIAYTAHIGGAFLGACLGFGLRYFRKSLWFRWTSQL